MIEFFLASSHAPLANVLGLAKVLRALGLGRRDEVVIVGHH